jgi:hypothetical protein
MPRRQEDWVRQRAERIDIGRARKALSVVTPVQAKLGGWQIQVARLRALAERGRANGEPVEAIAEEARQLLDEIEAHRRLLFEQSESLPPEVARHSRFQDVVRALATASAATHSVLRAGRAG